MKRLVKKLAVKARILKGVPSEGQDEVIHGLTLSVETVKELIDIDVDFYKDVHQDLKRHTTDELYQHYATYGYREGRNCHRLSVRENFTVVDENWKCLELGPFTNPVLTHDNAKYLDVLSTSELHERAQSLGLPTENIPNIDFVSRDGSLGLIDEKFDAIFSSHNLEHQPDLIGHLNEASAVLTDSGVYKMIVPNCAYCFDADLPPSKISEILLAHELRPKVHSLAKVIEHRALTVHNNSLKHWEDSIKGNNDYIMIDSKKVKDAIEEFEKAKGEYIDVHSWQFQPHTLSDILKNLIELNLIPFTSVRCYGSAYGRNEFCIELIK